MIHGTRPAESVLRSGLGFALTAPRRFDEALDCYQQALGLARRVGTPDAESRALAGIGDLYQLMGRHTEAIGHLERALAVGLENGQLPGTARPRHLLGKVYRELGRFDDAVANLGEALRIVRVMGGPVLESEVLIDIAATYRDIGNLAAASDFVDQGLRPAISRCERYQEARALHELAELHRCAARAELARDHWRRAHALFEELGTPEADQLRPLIDASAQGGAVA